ncbi:GntR family transcriptional regulator [bacterium 1XD42-1]|nr:GntR family transcriptional regulator [bacterium 1XD42-8]RKJ63280.1 GntR family transcriptional regulator [bacterium 1XD42-1]
MEMKYKFLANLLRNELSKNGSKCGYRLPTEAELTRRYQVSRQTVRHALQLLAEEGLVQKRQGSGTYSTGKVKDAARQQIAVVTSFLDDYIFPTILHDAQGTFAREGFSTLVYATENRVGAERDILLQLLENPVGGILIEGSKTALPNPNADLYLRLRETGVPMVFLHGAYTELASFPCISDDNYGGGYLLAHHLIAQGHQNLAGVFKSDDVQGPQRYHGCISAIRDAGLPILDRCFRWYDTEDRLEMLEQRHPELLHRFLAERLGTATAVICYNDEIAYLLIQELLAMGKRTPDNVAIVSFDNSYYSQISPVPITSLRHRDKMGQIAAEHLLHIIRGGTGQSRSLEWELLVRSSG